MNESLPLLDLIGVRPIWVEGLTADALLLLRYGLVLINPDLDAAALARVTDRTLAEVTATPD